MGNAYDGHGMVIVSPADTMVLAYSFFCLGKERVDGYIQIAVYSPGLQTLRANSCGV